jgi:hypothetical protein
MYYFIAKYKYVFQTKIKTLGARQPQGEYGCKYQNRLNTRYTHQHAPPPPSKAGCQSVAAYLRVQFLSMVYEMHYINLFFWGKKISGLETAEPLRSEQHLHHLMLGSKARKANQNRPSRYMQKNKNKKKS